MSTPVPHYGLHTSPEGVVYLHQGRGSNNFIGLKQSSPFAVIPRKALPCPHLINQAAPVPDVAQWQQFSKLLNDPLVQAMLPIPKEVGEPAAYLPDPQNEMMLTLVALSRMSGPIYPVVHELRKMTRAQVMHELAITNACPLVLTSVQCEDNAYINELAKEAQLMPRRLVFTGDPAVVIRHPLARIQSHLWDADRTVLVGLPLENLGALLLRRFARGERLDAEIVRGGGA